MAMMKRVREAIWEILPVDIEAKKEAERDKAGGGTSGDDDLHISEAVNWLARAQDAGNDDGVSRAYSAASASAVGYLGWEPSYPETTGYIVPTMLEVARHTGNQTYRDRALRMLDWEAQIQMDSGAVMGSVVSAPRSPAVFNTGQVIFGWLAGFGLTRHERYLTAARRAGDYLVTVQDTDGSWRKGNSRYALASSTVYNARVAWALGELGAITNNHQYTLAARRNIEYALGRQQENGWFSDNCLTEPDRPLLHTIVYAIRGVLESGVLLNEIRYVDAATRALASLLSCQRRDGGVPGRLAADWSAQADWDCVTGDAQLAGAWLRLHAIAGGAQYRVAARRVIEFIKRTQNLDHRNPGIRGGVKGSFPFDGPYGRFELLNWAAKFFIDALLMVNDEALASKGVRG